MQSTNLKNSQQQLVPLMAAEDSNVFPMDNVTDDKVSDESSHLLHMPEEDNYEKTGKKLEKTKVSSILPDSSAEPKDDILDKCVNMENTILENVDEEKLLNDGGDDKEAAVPSDKPASDSGKQEDEAKSMMLNSECDKDSQDDKASNISPDSSAEPKDDILNKFVNMENTILKNVDEKLEEKLLNDAGDDKEATVSSDKPASDSGKQEDETKCTLLNSDCNKDYKEDSSANGKMASVVSAAENEVDSNNVDNDKKTCVDSDDTNKQKSGGDCDKCGAASDDSEISANVEDNATEEKANAEILKDQIMDTEDLLQIVDKDTEENNDKNSSGGSSPRLVGKGESDDTEMECYGTETEKVDHQEEKRETDKDAVKEDDGVDIEDDIPFRDEFDRELDKEYEKMAKDDEYKSCEDEEICNEAKSSETTDTATAEAEADKNAVKAKDISLHEASVNEDVGMKIAPCDEDVAMAIAPCDEDVAMAIAPCDEDSNKKSDPKDDAISVTNDASRSGVTEECSSAEKEETTVQKDVEPAAANIEDAVPDAGAIDTSTKSSKRSLSDSSTASDSKKIKLQENHSDLAVPECITVEMKEKKFEEAPVECDVPAPCSRIVALNAVSQYMQNKKLQELSRNTLEQMCVMKMCEAIFHRSELGELRHRLGVQKQKAEMWGEEVMRLKNRVRDVQIVTNRVLPQVREKNEQDNLLLPMKITRSVGLQVLLNSNASPDKQNRSRPRKQNRSRPRKQNRSRPRKQNRSRPRKQNRNVENETIINVPTKVVTTPTKIVTTVSNKVTTPSKIATTVSNKVTTPAQVLCPKSPKSLLLQALQNAVAQAVAAIPATTTAATPTMTATRTTTVAASTTSDVPTATALTPTTSSTTFTVSSPTTSTMPVPTSTLIASKSVMNSFSKLIPKLAVNSNAFIDLTDKDDKISATASMPTTTTVTASTGQSIRIVSAPVTAGNVVTTAGEVNRPRVMCLYNNQLHQGVLTTDASGQKLMVELNSNVTGQAIGVNTTGATGSTTAVSNSAPTTSKPVLQHPAPLPLPPVAQISLPACKPVPPKPHLFIRQSRGGVVLSWKMPYNLDNYESITSYQLYAYQETTSPPISNSWRKVGDVEALALPIACTLTQFGKGNKYHFAVRAVDQQKRMGPFSDPEQIFL